MKIGFFTVLAATTLAAPAYAQTTDTPDPAPEVGYQKGFFVSDGPNKLVIQGRVQSRFTYEEPDSGDEKTQFSIARARLTLEGHVFEDDINYKFQSDFGKGSVVLKDFYVDYKPGAGPVRIRAGQWKRPFSRQQINSSGRLELVDRAITDKAFGAGRDIGVAVHDNYEKSPEIEWVVGVFNGTGDKPWFEGDVEVDPMTGVGEVTSGKLTNVPDHLQPAAVARIGYNANGIKGYSEADLEGGPLRFGVGASALAELDTDGDDSSSVRAELDYVVKSRGFSTTGGVYIASAQDGGGFGDQSFAAVGFHVQAGYILQGKVQPVVRYAMFAPDGDDNDVQEVTAGFSIYSHEHGFKWQTDASALVSETAGDAANDLRARTQLQLSF